MTTFGLIAMGLVPPEDATEADIAALEVRVGAMLPAAKAMREYSATQIDNFRAIQFDPDKSLGEQELAATMIRELQASTNMAIQALTEAS